MAGLYVTLEYVSYTTEYKYLGNAPINELINIQDKKSNHVFNFIKNLTIWLQSIEHTVNA